MADIKFTIAKNISNLRKNNKFTQAELAEKLNYSDKAVSKWERGESVPDVSILKQIADLFGVSVDYLLESEHTVHDKKAQLSHSQKRNRIIISLLSIVLVFFIVTLLYITLGLAIRRFGSLWTLYIYALPIALIVAIVFNGMWGKRPWTFVLITLLMWSILTVVYVACIPMNIWPVFFVGIPGQIIIMLWAGLKKK